MLSSSFCIRTYTHTHMNTYTRTCVLKTSPVPDGLAPERVFIQSIAAVSTEALKMQCSEYLQPRCLHVYNVHRHYCVSSHIHARLCMYVCIHAFNVHTNTNFSWCIYKLNGRRNFDLTYIHACMHIYKHVASHAGTQNHKPITL
jgi:hypothetical protein